MFVVNPDPYLLPSYRISPFQTNDIAKNINLPINDEIDNYFKENITNNYAYVANGRVAINKALSFLDLKKEDTVTILTTSGNFYISGCVTKEIEKFCNWSRVFTNTTKAIFVNHEFGFPYEDLESLKRYNLPIIEDCAHSFFSKDKRDLIGKVGDFVIYSFPKIFPIQIGGLLTSNCDVKLQEDTYLEDTTLKYIKNVLSHYIVTKDVIVKKRIDNYKFLNKQLKKIGFTERFKLLNNIIPGVFMFKANNDLIDLTKLKIYVQSHGIQCSVFYGENSFFIPCHQNLSPIDLNYFVTVLKSFKNEV